MLGRCRKLLEPSKSKKRLVWFKKGANLEGFEGSK
jgi:hypothetical protein